MGGEGAGLEASAGQTTWSSQMCAVPWLARNTSPSVCVHLTCVCDACESVNTQARVRERGWGGRKRERERENARARVCGACESENTR